jgi:HEAT repeat protein
LQPRLSVVVRSHVVIRRSRSGQVAFAICVALTGPPHAIAADIPALRAPCASVADCVAALERFTPGHSQTLDDGTWLPARVARVGGAVAVPSLRYLLTEARDEEVREAAARALGLLGSAARPAIPDLVRAANSGNDYALIALVDLNAHEALDVAARNADTSHVAAYSLVQRLGDPGLAEVGRHLRGNRDLSGIIDGLRDRGDEVKKLASDILFAIRNRKSSVERLELAELILRLGPPHLRERIRLAIKDLLAWKNKQVRDDTERVLAVAGDEKAMRSWLKRLGRRGQLGIIDYDGYRTICAMGSRAAPALARLTTLARSAVTDDWDEQTLAVEAIGCIGTPASVPVLIQALSSPSHRMVRAATDALERIAPAEAAGPLIELAKQHWHPAIRAAATRALAAAQGNKLPPPPTPPVHTEPPGETFACYGDAWPAAATSTVLVDRGKTAPVPPRLNGVKGLTSYVAIPEGWVATADEGEFGGGLYFVPSDRGNAIEISGANFHYVARRTDGLVAIEGIGHITINRGALWRIKKDNGGFVARPWVELPSRPLGVREAAGGLIVVDSDLGPVAVDPNGQITTGPCRTLSDEAREVLQALLDDPQLQGVIDKLHAPTPLPVGLWWIEEDAQGLTFRGSAVRSQRTEPATIDAGSFLEISGLEFFPSSAKAEVHFAYPDLAFVGHATFARTNQRWRVASFRIAPLERVRL